jgi:hypothetical protein
MNISALPIPQSKGLTACAPADPRRCPKYHYGLSRLTNPAFRDSSLDTAPRRIAQHE